MKNGAHCASAVNEVLSRFGILVDLTYKAVEVTFASSMLMLWLRLIKLFTADAVFGVLISRRVNGADA
ncbi:MAG: hypothetical protein ACKESB_00670 [Candidatus Hodgkinia cicadicola]